MLRPSALGGTFRLEHKYPLLAAAVAELEKAKRYRTVLFKLRLLREHELNPQLASMPSPDYLGDRRKRKGRATAAADVVEFIDLTAEQTRHIEIIVLEAKPHADEGGASAAARTVKLEDSAATAAPDMAAAAASEDSGSEPDETLPLFSPLRTKDPASADYWCIGKPLGGLGSLVGSLIGAGDEDMVRDMDDGFNAVFDLRAAGGDTMLPCLDRKTPPLLLRAGDLRVDIRWREWTDRGRDPGMGHAYLLRRVPEEEATAMSDPVRRISWKEFKDKRFSDHGGKGE